MSEELIQAKLDKILKLLEDEKLKKTDYYQWIMKQHYEEEEKKK